MTSLQLKRLEGKRCGQGLIIASYLLSVLLILTLLKITACQLNA